MPLWNYKMYESIIRDMAAGVISPLVLIKTGELAESGRLLIQED